MTKRGFWNSVAILLLGLIVVVLVVGILSFLSKNVELPIKNSELSEYNIAFGYTAPADTTKLWVKCAEPKKIEISDTINKTVTNEKIEKLDWELDLGNQVTVGALVGTDLYLNVNGITKLDLLTGECTEASSSGGARSPTNGIAVPYGQYIYFAYTTVSYTYEYLSQVHVRKFNTVNNQFVGSWTSGTTTTWGSSPSTAIHGFIYNDVFCIYAYSSYAFDLEKCTFSDNFPCHFSGYSATAEFLNDYIYSFGNYAYQEDLTGVEEKKQYDFPYTSNFNFTSKGIGNNIYLFGKAGSLSGNAIQRFNSTSGKTDVLDLIMSVERQSPIVARLGANFYILGGCSASGNTIVEKFTTEFELEKGTLILLTNGKQANEIVLRTDKQGVDYKASISCAYIGNSQGKGESVEVYLYDNDLSDWRLIAA